MKAWRQVEQGSKRKIALCSRKCSQKKMSQLAGEQGMGRVGRESATAVAALVPAGRQLAGPLPTSWPSCGPQGCAREPTRGPGRSQHRSMLAAPDAVQLCPSRAAWSLGQAALRYPTPPTPADKLFAGSRDVCLGGRGQQLAAAHVQEGHKAQVDHLEGRWGFVRTRALHDGSSRRVLFAEPH